MKKNGKKNYATILDEGKRHCALIQDGRRPERDRAPRPPPAARPARGPPGRWGVCPGGVRRCLRPGLYEAAAGRAVSGWPRLGDMDLLREDTQNKVRTAAQVWLRSGAGAAVSRRAQGRARSRAGPAGCDGAPRSLCLPPAAL